PVSFLDGALHRFLPAPGVKGEHVHREVRQAFHCSGDGVGDVVQLEVEENLRPPGRDFLDQSGAVATKELEPDLYPPQILSHLIERAEGWVAVREIESDDEFGRARRCHGLEMNTGSG